MTHCVNEPDKVGRFDYAVIIGATLFIMIVLHLLAQVALRTPLQAGTAQAAAGEATGSTREQRRARAQ